MGWTAERMVSILRNVILNLIGPRSLNNIAMMCATDRKSQERFATGWVNGFDLCERCSVVWF